MIKPSNLGFMQVTTQCLKKGLTNDRASLMSRLSMLVHESLTASEIFFVEFPLFLVFPVISWLVADGEALLSSSLYPSHVTFARLSLKMGQCPLG